MVFFCTVELTSFCTTRKILMSKDEKNVKPIEFHVCDEDDEDEDEVGFKKVRESIREFIINISSRAKLSQPLSTNGLSLRR